MSVLCVFVAVAHLVRRILTANCSVKVHLHSTLAVNIERGLAILAKFLIRLLVILVM